MPNVTPTHGRGHGHLTPNRSSASRTNTTTPHPTPHHLPPRSTTSTTTTHQPPHPIPPLIHAHRLGRTKTQTENTTTNPTTTHTPWLALLRNGDLRLGQSYPHPPQSYPSETPAPRPGQTYATINTDSIPPSPLHLPHVRHPGPSYPTTSTQLHKTAETPSGESRLGHGIFWTKPLFKNLILILTLTYINNPDFCTLLYHYITIPSPPLSFCLFGFQSRCVRAHTVRF